jgi:hypothetical protein
MFAAHVDEENTFQTKECMEKDLYFKLMAYTKISWPWLKRGQEGDLMGTSPLECIVHYITWQSHQLTNYKLLVEIPVHCSIDAFIKLI